MENGWVRADVIGAWTLGITVVGVVGTWLAVPGFREWLQAAWRASDLIDLGDLSGAMPYEQPMSPGIARAAELTLGEIAEALPESSMEWLHEKDFGNSFRWNMVEFVENFAWQPQVPAREFLDRELESLRVDLVASAKNFVHLAAAYTDDLHPASDDDMRKIPDQEDEHGNYSDRLFFEKRDELNDAAEATWTAYQKLILRARLKLAHSVTAPESQ